jgi:hypothetical protein
VIPLPYRALVALGGGFVAGNYAALAVFRLGLELRPTVAGAVVWVAYSAVLLWLTR